MRISRPRLIPLAIWTLLLASLAMGGCQGQDVIREDSSAKQRVRISGSGTCLPLMRILTEAYEAEHPEIEFVYLPGLHSGGGIKGVANGDLEIGAVSRDLNEDERGLGLEYVKLSDDGLVIAVHPSVTIDGLSSEQVREIYQGRFENWTELGGPDLPMVVLDRNEDESAKIILRQYVLGKDLDVTERAVNLFYEPDMVDGLKMSPGAVGYFSLGFGLSENVSVRYLKLDGVEASVENIGNDVYGVIRPLGLVYEPSASQEINEFIEWAQSAEARELMAERGFAPPIAQ